MRILKTSNCGERGINYEYFTGNPYNLKIHRKDNIIIIAQRAWWLWEFNRNAAGT